MRIINGTIGALLAALAFLHISMPEGAELTLAYALGAALAFISLVPSMSIPVARTFAVLTTVCMFFYFAGFFSLAPELHSEWYRGMQAREAFSQLMSAFFMIPVLSCYSCRLKAEQREAMAQKRRTGFFSVPRSAASKIST